MIRLVVFDIDGVITDGMVIVDVNGTEQKMIKLKDVDAIFELHREGFRLAAITGENTEIVEADNVLELTKAIKKLVENKDFVEKLSKNSLGGIKEYSFENMVGDFIKVLG